MLRPLKGEVSSIFISFAMRFAASIAACFASSSALVTRPYSSNLFGAWAGAIGNQPDIGDRIAQAELGILDFEMAATAVGDRFQAIALIVGAVNLIIIGKRG